MEDLGEEVRIETFSCGSRAGRNDVVEIPGPVRTVAKAAWEKVASQWVTQPVYAASREEARIKLREEMIANGKITFSKPAPFWMEEAEATKWEKAKYREILDKCWKLARNEPKPEPVHTAHAPKPFEGRHAKPLSHPALQEQLQNALDAGKLVVKERELNVAVAALVRLCSGAREQGTPWGRVYLTPEVEMTLSFLQLKLLENHTWGGHGLKDGLTGRRYFTEDWIAQRALKEMADTSLERVPWDLRRDE